MSYSLFESPEKRVADRFEETIVFQAGYLKDSSDRGWFCKVVMNNLCVEDFGITKRSALRKTRKAWQNASGDRYQKLNGYPRVIPCDNGESV